MSYFFGSKEEKLFCDKAIETIKAESDHKNAVLVMVYLKCYEQYKQGKIREINMRIINKIFLYEFCEYKFGDSRDLEKEKFFSQVFSDCAGCCDAIIALINKDADPINEIKKAEKDCEETKRFVLRRFSREKHRYGHKKDVLRQIENSKISRLCYLNTVFKNKLLSIGKVGGYYETLLSY